MNGRRISLKTAFITLLLLLLCCPTFASAEDEYCDHEIDYEEYYECNYVDSSHHSITGTCYICNEEVTLTVPHDWDSWETTRKATVFRKGKKTRECLDCYETQTKSIAKIKPFAKFRSKTYSVIAGKSLKISSKLKMGRGDKVKKWKVSGSAATVTKSGKLKAKKAGKVKITAILKSGKKATCTVKVKTPKKAAKKTVKKKSSSSTVYWVSGGSVYHVSRNCRTLKRSKKVYSGTKAQSGKSRCCKVCG